MSKASLSTVNLKKVLACELEENQVTIGRLSSNEMCVAADSLSRRHAQVQFRNGAYYLRDLNSSNGVFYSGKRIKSMKLADGTQFRLGDVEFVFKAAAGPSKDGATIKRQNRDGRDGRDSGQASRIVQQLRVGDELGGYRLENEISKDKLQTTFEAYQISMDRTVALKVLNPRHTNNPEFVAKFTDQARTTGQLNHPSIIHTLDCNEVEGHFFFTLEWVEGESVEDILAKQRRIEPITALTITQHIAEGLGHIHEKGLLHKDVKPECLIYKEGSEAKLADVGLYSMFDSDISFKGRQLIGTPHYMSPEHAANRKLLPASDVYCLGATLYHMLSGRTVFSADTTIGLITQHLKTTPIPLRQYDMTIPDELNDIVMEMLAKDPELRPSTDKLLKVLPSLIKELDHEKPKKKAVKKNVKRTRRRSVAGQARRQRKSNAPLMIGIFAALIIIGGFVVSNLGGPNAPSARQSGGNNQTNKPSSNRPSTASKSMQVKLPVGPATRSNWGPWASAHGRWDESGGQYTHSGLSYGSLVSGKSIPLDEANATVQINGRVKRLRLHLGGTDQNYTIVELTPTMATLATNIRNLKTIERKKVALPPGNVTLNFQAQGNRLIVSLNRKPVINKEVGGLVFVEAPLSVIVEGNARISNVTF